MVTEGTIRWEPNVEKTIWTCSADYAPIERRSESSSPRRMQLFILPISNHERFSQTVTDRHFVVEPKCDSGALFARPANPRVDLLCPACSKTCVSNSYLISHMRSHTGEKPFACAECDKKFSHNGNLTLHMGYHTGEKPFACVNCDKRFSQRGKLTIHIRSRTGAKGIRSHRLSGMSAD